MGARGLVIPAGGRSVCEWKGVQQPSVGADKFAGMAMQAVKSGLHRRRRRDGFKHTVSTNNDFFPFVVL